MLKIIPVFSIGWGLSLALDFWVVEDIPQEETNMVIDTKEIIIRKQIWEDAFTQWKYPR